MTEYNFFAVASGDGWSIRDRWQLEADSFEDACIYAQENNDDVDVIYTEFVEVVKHD